MSAGYSDSEDRIWLRFGADEGAVQLWMTRRMLAKALPQLWGLLARTAALPSGVTDDPAQRRVALLAEREVVLEVKAGDTTQQARTREPKAMAHRPEQAGVLSRILAERKGRGFRLNFLSNGGQVGMAFSRAELHRMLNMLSRRADAAGWNLEAPWAAEPTPPAAPQGVSG